MVKLVLIVINLVKLVTIIIHVLNVSVEPT